MTLLSGLTVHRGSRPHRVVTHFRPHKCSDGLSNAAEAAVLDALVDLDAPSFVEFSEDCISVRCGTRSSAAMSAGSCPIDDMKNCSVVIMCDLMGCKETFDSGRSSQEGKVRLKCKVAEGCRRLPSTDSASVFS